MEKEDNVRCRRHMNKKGSQIGFVISFVIFIIFITALFIVIKPLNVKSNSQEFILDLAKRQITESSSDILHSISIKIQDSSVISKECIKFKNPHLGDSDYRNLTVKDENGNVINSYWINGEYVVIKSSDKFFTLYGSGEFPSREGAPNCNGIEDLEKDDNYTIGLSKETKYVFWSKMNILKDKHASNYENLKKNFSLPQTSEFGFILKNGRRINVINADKSPVSSNVNIYADETPVEYVDQEAKVNQGWLYVKVF